MSNATKETQQVCFITLGCAKNEVDTSRMRERLMSAGFAIVDQPELADVVIVNTCSFIQAATEESIEVILDMSNIDKAESKDTKIIVAGCMPSRYGSDLYEELSEVSAFVTCQDEENIVDAVLASLDTDFVPSNTESEIQEILKPSAYVKISEGCDRYCSFCAIPAIRGPYRSFSLEEIELEVESLVTKGTKEIVFIGQDTGRWGRDFEWPSSLAVLLARCADKFPDTWFRVMYLQPEGISDTLLDTMSKYKNICSYLDIPFQHVDSKILEDMNRTGSREEFLKLIAHIRRRVPGVTLRTTFIAGFPGESETEFESLCSFIEEIEFDYVGVFAYSREDGTRAADFFEQIDEDTKLERAQSIRDIADAISIVKVAQRIGETMDVLVLDREEDGQLYGRAQCQAPDVDGVTYLESGSIGEICEVSIVDTLFYEMEGA